MRNRRLSLAASDVDALLVALSWGNSRLLGPAVVARVARLRRRLALLYTRTHAVRVQVRKEVGDE